MALYEEAHRFVARNHIPFSSYSKEKSETNGLRMPELWGPIFPSERRRGDGPISRWHYRHTPIFVEENRRVPLWEVGWTSLVVLEVSNCSLAKKNILMERVQDYY